MRISVLVNIAVFVGFSGLYIFTEAPLIQADILKRCQDVLLARNLPAKDLSVDGQDVFLSGPPESAVTAPRTRHLLEQVRGVRLVAVKAGDSTGDISPDSGNRPSSNWQQRDTQLKIDRVLKNQEITFETGDAVLTPEGEALLDKISSFLMEASSLQCEIRGFYNTAADSHQNWTLALQRTLATEDYLIGKGVAEWRLSTQASQANNGDGRPANRVIDLVVEVR